MRNILLIGIQKKPPAYHTDKCTNNILIFYPGKETVLALLIVNLAKLNAKTSGTAPNWVSPETHRKSA